MHFFDEKDTEISYLTTEFEDVNFEDLSISDEEIDKEIAEREIDKRGKDIISLAKSISDNMIKSKDKACIEYIPLYGTKDKSFSFKCRWKSTSRSLYDIEVEFYPMDSNALKGLNMTTKVGKVKIVEISKKISLADALAEAITSIILKLNGKDRIILTK